MEQVATRAKVSKDSLYRRFPGKLALVTDALAHRARAVRMSRTLGQQRVRVGGQAEGGQHVTADRLPRLAFQEPGLWVAPPGGGVGVQVS
jgi:AcrR family transcriptional regulator